MDKKQAIELWSKGNHTYKKIGQASGLSTQYIHKFFRKKDLKIIKKLVDIETNKEY